MIRPPEVPSFFVVLTPPKTPLDPGAERVQKRSGWAEESSFFRVDARKDFCTPGVTVSPGLRWPSRSGDFGSWYLTFSNALRGFRSFTVYSAPDAVSVFAEDSSSGQYDSDRCLSPASVFMYISKSIRKEKSSLLSAISSTGWKASSGKPKSHDLPGKLNLAFA